MEGRFTIFAIALFVVSNMAQAEFEDDTCKINMVTGVTEFSDTSYEACEILVLGPDFIAADGANVSANAGWEIDLMPGFFVEQGATFKANVCGQSLCMTSPNPMPYGCHSCVTAICDVDSFCCTDEFDSVCLAKVDSVCALVCEVFTDSDNDRLSDSAETNTGVYVDFNNTGTDPNNSDTDGDGIKDGDEVLGTLGGLDLPRMGVNPLRKDLLLEYDWFDDNVDSEICSSHSHRPTAAAIASITASFNTSPETNVDGSSGVNLINDYGQGGEFTGGNFINDANGVIDGGVSGSDFLAYKAANFTANRNGYFHYVLLPHRYNTDSGSSGQAELYGDDMIVSLYCYGSDKNVAHTIMHEVGHNLSLHHGGDNSCNYKPNYNSVMNYKYQFPGVDNNCTPAGDGVLDYSYGDRIDLNENNLNENNGTCGAGNPFDWNDNMSIESSVVFDINSADSNQSSACGGTLTTLLDTDDWGRLYFLGIGDADGAPIAPTEIITEQPVPPEFFNSNN